MDGILLAFLFLVQRTGSFSFNGFAAVPISDPAILSATFGFALLEFGTKAVIFWFHIWLPYAYPEAPSPVSAVMSGIMIKMEIYRPGGQLIMINPAGIGCNVPVISPVNAYYPNNLDRHAFTRKACQVDAEPTADFSRTIKFYLSRLRER